MNAPSTNLVGMVFNRLTVLKYEHGKWVCQCSCGNTKIVQGYDLRNGKVKSCGCYNKELGRLSHEKAFPNRIEYSPWKNMKARCYNTKTKQYKDYGGRGIVVCDRWRNDFLAFLEDIGPRPSKAHSIHRIDNDGNYDPSNCKWATRKEQAFRRRNTRYIEYKGKKLTLLEIRQLIPREQQAEISDYALADRIFNAKWDVMKALTKPECQGRKPKFDHDYAPNSKLKH